jgi:hypothetical protein
MNPEGISTEAVSSVRRLLHMLDNVEPYFIAEILLKYCAFLSVVAAPALTYRVTFCAH